MKDLFSLVALSAAAF